MTREEKKAAKRRGEEKIAELRRRGVKWRLLLRM
jgi:hypothetical protein